MTHNEILIGIKEIAKELGPGAEVEVMKKIVEMKRAGYDVTTDENGVWMVPLSEIVRFNSGGTVPEADEPKKPEPKKPAGAKGGPADKGPYKMVHRGRGKWAITGPDVKDFEETYTKKAAAAMVKELNGK